VVHLLNHFRHVHLVRKEGDKAGSKDPEDSLHTSDVTEQFEEAVDGPRDFLFLTFYPDVEYVDGSSVSLPWWFELSDRSNSVSLNLFFLAQVDKVVFQLEYSLPQKNVTLFIAVKLKIVVKSFVNTVADRIFVVFRVDHWINEHKRTFGVINELSLGFFIGADRSARHDSAVFIQLVCTKHNFDLQVPEVICIVVSF